MQHDVRESASDSNFASYLDHFHWSWSWSHRSTSAHAEALHLAVGTREPRHVRFTLEGLSFPLRCLCYRPSTYIQAI